MIILKALPLKNIVKYTGYIFIGSVVFSLYGLFVYYSHSVTLDVTLAAVLATIFFLITGLLMEYLSVLIFMAAMVLLRIAPAHIAFSGFTSDGFWLIFSGTLLSMAIKKTGLANRISFFMKRLFFGGYMVLVIGVVLFGLVMAFIMPSAMARIVLMLPIIMEYAEENGFQSGSKGYDGLVLASVLGTYIAGFAILPSNLPNIILMGAMRSLYHQNLVYAQYLWLNFPVLGGIKLVLLTFVVTKLFSETPSSRERDSNPRKTRLSPLEKKLTFYLVILLIAWLSDSMTHLSPAWPALAIAVICLLPKIGIINQKNFFKEAKVEPLFYVGGLIGLSAVIHYTGLGRLLGSQLISVLPLHPGHNSANYYLMNFLAMGIGMITTLPGIPAIMTPLSGGMAKLTHLPLATVLMTQVVGFSTFILPYQAPPIIVALRMGGVRLSVATKLCFIMMLLSLIILLPLNYGWWTLLGAI